MTAPDRCRSSPAPIGHGARSFRSAEGGPARCGNARLPGVVRGGLQNRCCPEGRPWPISGLSPYTRSTTATAVLRAPSPTWLWRGPRHSPQRFYSMSAQIRQERNDVLRHSGTDAERHPGYHALDGVVPRLPWPRHRRGSGALSAVLDKAKFWETHQGHSDQRPSAAGDQPPA